MLMPTHTIRTTYMVVHRTLVRIACITQTSRISSIDLHNASSATRRCKGAVSQFNYSPISTVRRVAFLTQSTEDVLHLMHCMPCLQYSIILFTFYCDSVPLENNIRVFNIHKKLSNPFHFALSAALQPNRSGSCHVACTVPRERTRALMRVRPFST